MSEEIDYENTLNFPIKYVISPNTPKDLWVLTRLLHVKTQPKAQVKKERRACNTGLLAMGPLYDTEMSPFVSCIE